MRIRNKAFYFINVVNSNISFLGVQRSHCRNKNNSNAVIQQIMAVLPQPF